ncbi:MAG: hypothetical protein JXA71_09525 [Chitinispirillaceae bacterium]|nr:hypothetical protein [Chitinispirillaceae bacterium]
MNRFLTAIACALMVLCKGTNDPDSGSSPIKQVWELHITDNAVAGWIEDVNRYQIFDTTILFNIIDGGAPKFIEQGLVGGIVQVMLYDTLFECIIYAEDFGSPQNARNMLNAIKIDVQEMPLRIPGFDSTTAVAKEYIGGAFVAAIFNRFYIELHFSGYEDVQQALGDAASFLQVYRNKILP